MKIPRLNILDWIIVAVALGTVAVVVYRYKTEGFFHLEDLLLMLMAVSSYVRFRVGKKNVSNYKEKPTGRNAGGR